MSKKDEVRALTKADPFLESLQKLGGFVRSHQTVVVASIVVFLLVGAGVAFGFNRADKQAGVASKLLAEAQKTFDKMPLGDAPPAAAAASGDGTEEKYATKDEWRAAVNKKFTDIDTQFPNSGASRVGKLYRASLELDAKNPAEAEKLYRAFLAETKDTDPMAAAARMSLAAALEDQAKIDEAIKELAALVPTPVKDDAKKKPNPIAEEALLAMAHLQERAKKTADARATYERIKIDFPTSSANFKAEQRLNQLPKE